MCKKVKSLVTFCPQIWHRLFSSLLVWWKKTKRDKEGREKRKKDSIFFNFWCKDITDLTSSFFVQEKNRKKDEKDKKYNAISGGLIIYQFNWFTHKKWSMAYFRKNEGKILIIPQFSTFGLENCLSKNFQRILCFVSQYWIPDLSRRDPI